MDRNDGGPAIDLESLRAALAVIQRETVRAGGVSFSDGRDLIATHAAVSAALAELTTRRARDEDVAGLGEALVKISDHIRATDPCPDFGWIEAIATEALAPFTGATR
jgi:hypothetical protein